MLAELLAQHPDVARRTAQRWITQWIDGGQITAIGEGRARRYFVAKTTEVAATTPERDRFPGYIPLSAGVVIDVSMLEALAEWMTMALVSASAIHGTTLAPALAT
uniref:hypothetical protein n=1 Tax=Cupriavidus necator TaxID=106590 RepID=UPI003F495755